MLNVCVIILNAIKFIVALHMLNVIMLSVIMLNVVMQCVEAPDI
jgi:hypothetical protein